MRLPHDHLPMTFLLSSSTVTISPSGPLHIDSLDEGVYYANLMLYRDNQEEMMDCRPSDGIAIALRCKSDIFLERSVAELSGIHTTELPPFIGLQAYLYG